MTTVKKAIVANYSQDTITSLVSYYQESRQKGQDNATILLNLASIHGKSIPSIRAKLASLKVYQKDVDTGNVISNKATKSDLVLGLESLTGLSLTSLEAATKTELLSLAEYLDDLLETVHELKARI